MFVTGVPNLDIFHPFFIYLIVALAIAHLDIASLIANCLVEGLLREKTREIPGIEKISVVATTPIKQILMGGGKQVEIEIMGHSLKETNAIAEKIRKIMEGTSGAIDIRISRKEFSP